jgi:hypothetical protein
MQSESAKMTTREEARFRIPYANSKRRDIKVIALDDPSAMLIKELSQKEWNGAQFFTAAPVDRLKQTGESGLKAWLNDLKGHTLDLVQEVAHSDFVVVITRAGEDAQAVSMIAEICETYHKSLIALLVPRPDDSEDAINASLRHLRPYARMLVVTHGPDYVETMLTALRA